MSKTAEEILGKKCGMTIDEDAYRIQTKTEYIIQAMEEYAQAYHTAKLEEVKGFSSDEEIEAMIKISELKARSAEEWLSLFEGAQWMRSIDQSILAKKDAEISTLKAEIANLKEANIEYIGEVENLKEVAMKLFNMVHDSDLIQNKIKANELYHIISKD